MTELPMCCVATICARGGSKGLPGKNVRNFAGKPLIVHSIEQALSASFIHSVWVSTDDADIARIARDAGAQVPFLRPAELASDSAPKIPVIEHLAKHIEASGLRVDTVIDLQPTSPLRSLADIQGAYAMRADTPLVVSVRPAGDNPYFNMVELNTHSFAHLSKGNGMTRRQDTPSVFALNGAIYVWQRTALAQASLSGMWSVGMRVFEMPEWRSVDIDNIDDFDYAQWLYARHASVTTIKEQL
jgi:CMP-N,N'-diacetyllegionaminic acid synthase